MALPASTPTPHRRANADPYGYGLGPTTTRPNSPPGFQPAPERRKEGPQLTLTVVPPPPSCRRRPVPRGPGAATTTTPAIPQHPRHPGPPSQHPQPHPPQHPVHSAGKRPEKPSRNPFPGAHRSPRNWARAAPKRPLGKVCWPTAASHGPNGRVQEPICIDTNSAER